MHFIVNCSLLRYGIQPYREMWPRTSNQDFPLNHRQFWKDERCAAGAWTCNLMMASRAAHHYTSSTPVLQVINGMEIWSIDYFRIFLSPSWDPLPLTEYRTSSQARWKTRRWAPRNNERSSLHDMIVGRRFESLSRSRKCRTDFPAEKKSKTFNCTTVDKKIGHNVQVSQEMHCSVVGDDEVVEYGKRYERREKWQVRQKEGSDDAHHYDHPLLADFQVVLGCWSSCQYHDQHGYYRER